MNLSVAWVLFGGMTAGAGIIAGSQGTPMLGFIIALISTILSKSGKWYFWNKKS